GIVRVRILEGPAAGANVGAPRDPIATHIERLFGDEPVEPAFDRGVHALAADFQQRVTGEAGVPDRRDAWLAVCLLLVHYQELFDGFAGDRAVRMIFRIAEEVEHHDAVRHRGENRAHAVFAVEMLDRPGDGAVDRALPR